MSKEELIEALRINCFTGDAESDHTQADRLLLTYIDDAEVTKLYERIEKWYA